MRKSFQILDLVCQVLGLGLSLTRCDLDSKSVRQWKSHAAELSRL